MPGFPNFNFPYFNPYNRNYGYYNKHYNSNNTYKHNLSNNINNNNANKTKQSCQTESNNLATDLSSNPLFEIFGLKLYMDDILILCLLYFLYEENVKDELLFISLLMLLLS